MENKSFGPVLGKGWLSTTYGIRNGEVFAERGGFSGFVTRTGKAFRDSVPLEDVANITYTGKAVGDVFFKLSSGATALTWANVFRPAAKRQLALDFKSAVANEARQEGRNASLSAEKHRRLLDIRDNTKYSDQVLRMPAIGGIFHKHFWYKSGSGSLGYPRHMKSYGEWINKGDIVCVFGIELPGLFGGKLSLPIYSPVSGRVLSNTSPSPPGMGCNTLEKNEAFDFGVEPLLSIQIPQGNVAQDEITAHSYGEFADLCWQHRKKLFVSDTATMGDDHLEALLRKMKSFKFPIVGLDHGFSYMAKDPVTYRKIVTDIDKTLGGLKIPDGPA